MLCSMKDMKNINWQEKYRVKIFYTRYKQKSPYRIDYFSGTRKALSEKIRKFLNKNIGKRIRVEYQRY